MTKLELGKTYYPAKTEIVATEDAVRGDGWSIEKVNGHFMLEFLAARHGGGTDKHQISTEEFYAVKRGVLSPDELIRKYDRN